MLQSPERLNRATHRGTHHPLTAGGQKRGAGFAVTRYATATLKECAVRLETVYARFFRSLNYDYLRKSDPRYVPDPWDGTPAGVHYPFVRVRLEDGITTVVGANESGKSQLLEAIKHGLTGDEVVRGDFCRYSPFFSTDSTLVVPEFGLQFGGLGPAHGEVIAQMCGLDEAPDAAKAALFRMNETPKLRLYLLQGADWTMHHVKKPTLLRQFGLPDHFQIDSSIPLPDAVPLDYLASGQMSPRNDIGRRQLELIRANFGSWFSSGATLAQSAEQVVAALTNAGKMDSEHVRMYELASDLLLKVAGLDRSLFVELRGAVTAGKNGYAGGIVDTVNRQLAASLNFPLWWSQDANFELFVDLRDIELAFMIRDRTGTSYSFDERSAGLKYFLSYFVQYLAHEPRADGQREILLMDEPDAYLSSSGQQDLLRIFDAFAHPSDPQASPVQVVYVTHSPFLIDKNHGERIRVLEKGEHDEGTRVVANASRNHYEPLRSALGSFVGETTFIGTTNLLLEGASDQILIAGVSSWLGRRGAPATDRLDLNKITLVPAGAASHVPYLAYIARGRDVDKPPLIVLLDADTEGNRARAELSRGGPRRRQLVAPEFVLQLNDESVADLSTANPDGVVGIEDLVPLELCHHAVVLYCEDLLPEADLSGLDVTAASVYADGNDTLKGLEYALRAHLNDDAVHLDKIGFARSVLRSLDADSADTAAAAVLERNFRTLLRELARMQRAADRDANQEKIRSRINRVRRRFEADHPRGARREDILLLIEEIEHQLDPTVEAEEVRAVMRNWIPQFDLGDDARAEVDNFEEFRRALGALAYTGTRAVQARS